MTEPLSPEGYAATGGLCCPACGGRDLAWHRIPLVPGAVLTRLVVCEDCGARWQAVYELVGYEGLQREEDPHA